MISLLSMLLTTIRHCRRQTAAPRSPGLAAVLRDVGGGEKAGEQRNQAYMAGEIHA
jgi:hypothetical protein